MGVLKEIFDKPVYSGRVLGDTLLVEQKEEKHLSHDQSTHGRGGGGGFESKEAAKKLFVYHGTRSAMVTQILEEGILAKPPQEGSMGRYVVVADQPTGVYFTKRRDSAASWGELSVRGYRGRSLPEGTEIAVFQVAIPKSRVIKDPKVSRAYYSEDKIAPELLRSVTYYKVMSGGGLDYKNPDVHKIEGGKVAKGGKEMVFVPVVVDGNQETKHLSHDQSTHGRGGGASSPDDGGTRVERAKRTHKPSTAEK